MQYLTIGASCTKTRWTLSRDPTFNFYLQESRTRCHQFIIELLLQVSQQIQINLKVVLWDSVQGKNHGAKKHLPALFDWSIIGWTILRLALINLEQKVFISAMLQCVINEALVTSGLLVNVHQNLAGANTFRHRK